MAISKEAGGVAVQRSRSHGRLAVTLSNSALKRLIPTTQVASQSERAILSPSRKAARRYLDSGCQPVVAKADRLFRKSTTGVKKPLQTQRILCAAAVALKVHKIKKNEP
jgi:hypothetical protein